MADGRMLKRSIATCEQLAAVSLEAAHLFSCCIPFLDIEGRLYGSPSRLKALVCPLRSELTPAVIDRCLGELHDVGLVVWYEAARGKWLAFPGFRRHNNVRPDREAASTIPPPPPEGGAPPGLSLPDGSRTTPVLLPEDSGKAPGVLPDDSGTTPAKGGREGNRSKEIIPRAPEAARRRSEGETQSFNFAPFVDAYCERFGEDPDKKDAAVLKQLVAKHGHDEVLVRYRRFLPVKGQFGIHQFRRTWGDWSPSPHNAFDWSAAENRHRVAVRLFSLLADHGLLTAGKEVFNAEVARLAALGAIKDPEEFMAFVNLIDIPHLRTITNRHFGTKYIEECLAGAPERRAAS